MVLISDEASISASNAVAQLGPEDTKGACGKSEDAEGNSQEIAPKRLISDRKARSEQKANTKEKPMGRYKSVLMAEKDARDFPHHVELPIQPFGLGKRLDVIAAWLNTNIGPDWRSHSHLEKGEHTARYMFRSEDDAAEFETAIKSDRI